MHLSPVSGRYFRQLGSDYKGGMKVVSVRPESLAARRGFRLGDIIVGMGYDGVDPWETVSFENIAYALNQSKTFKSKPIKVWVFRDNVLLEAELRTSQVYER